MTKSGFRGVYWKPRKNGGQKLRLPEGQMQDGVWAIRYMCALGHLHREEVGPKALAQHEYFRRKTEVRREGFCPRQKDSYRPTLFRDAARDYLTWSKAEKRSWKTDELWLKRLTMHFGGKTLDQITSEEVERFKGELASLRAKATVNRHLECLKHLFNRAIRDGRARVNPVRAVPLFKLNNERVRYLSPEEEKTLFAIIPEPYYTFCLVAMHTGLRRSELLNLRRQDVDFRAGVITVQLSKHGQARRLPMNSVVRNALKSLPVRLDQLLLFPNCRNVSQRFKALTRKAGIDDLHLHDLRHTFASRLAMAGVQLLTIKELMGHRSVEMALRYSHLSPDHKLEAVERLTSSAELIDTPQRIPVEKNRLIDAIR